MSSNLLQHKIVGIFGVGVMGQALVKGLLSQKLLQPSQLWATAKREQSCVEMSAALGITVSKAYQEHLQQTDVLLLCVKPAQIAKVLKTLTEQGLPAHTLVISIAAGVTLERLSEAVPNNPVIRAMPNTPATVGHGMTAVCSGAHVTDMHMAWSHAIFGAVGRYIELDETHFNAVTALCGSGPAYLYLIMEALADGGVRVGLPRDVALTMVSQTVLGAARMVQETGRHPAALRDDVTTPAGCTIAALLTLEDGKIRSVLARAVEEATQIAKSLG